jgi:putative transposase
MATPQRNAESRCNRTSCGSTRCARSGARMLRSEAASHGTLGDGLPAVAGIGEATTKAAWAWLSAQTAFRAHHRERSRLADCTQPARTTIQSSLRAQSNLGGRYHLHSYRRRLAATRWSQACSRLAGIKDLFSKKIVGWAMAEHMQTSLVLQALSMAVKQERPAQGLIQHSDRGSQYASAAYRGLLAQFGMKASMSRRGNCYDNAPMESFWASLKKEQVHHQHYKTRSQARADIFDYIESFYNTIRRHSGLANQSPIDFINKFVSKKNAMQPLL